ncbi:flavodoxin family protein [Algoriphagus sp.]|uniref:flavodoxin family protein n=1 Tax=Algoriphagus sp. TaxID=1872435 RepID=UPI003F72C082
MKYFILFIFLFSALSCTSQTQTEADINPVEMVSDKILIVYLTRTKNTKAVAEMIQKKVGGTLVSLELETPYPENYAAIVAQVAQENETGYLPPLKTTIDLSKYKTVFVGFPTWGMQLPPPMKTFLSENDLSGKTVIPFNTNAGYGIGSSFDSVEELCPESNILEGYSTTGGIERDGVLFVMEGEKEVEVRTAVNNWLSDLGF